MDVILMMCKVFLPFPCGFARRHVCCVLAFLCANDSCGGVNTTNVSLRGMPTLQYFGYFKRSCVTKTDMFSAFCRRLGIKRFQMMRV